MVHLNPFYFPSPPLHPRAPYLLQKVCHIYRPLAVRCQGWSSVGSGDVVENKVKSSPSEPTFWWEAEGTRQQIEKQHTQVGGTGRGDCMGEGEGNKRSVPRANFPERAAGCEGTTLSAYWWVLRTGAGDLRSGYREQQGSWTREKEFLGD